MNNSVLVAITLAAFLVCSHNSSAMAQNCGDGHSQEDLDRSETICRAGINSCCPRLQSVNFTCLCSSNSGVDISKDIISFARKCDVVVPLDGKCQETCPEGHSQEDIDRTEIICGAGIGSCCDRLKALNFYCLCAPNSGVNLPDTIFTSAKKCKVTIPQQGKCQGKASIMDM